MKKAIMMTGAFLLLMTTIALGAVADKQRFIDEVQDEIYNASQTGQLTYGETRTLRKQLNQYEDKLWQMSGFGRLTRQEEKILLRMEDRLIQNLDDLKYNRVTAYTENRNTRSNRGGYYGKTTRPGTYYGTGYGSRRTTRATTTRTRPNRGGGTYCPPPRRNNW